MTLAEGVPPNDVAATTDLGDVTYQHDDHHRDLAEVCDAYLEFLADSQTPYYIGADDSDPTPPLVSTQATTWFVKADTIIGGGPSPSSPLAALASPFVGPGTVTDPIGYQDTNPQYNGPGGFKTLKTGVLALSWSAQFQNDGVDADDAQCAFDIYCEDGTNQAYRTGSSIFPKGATGQSSDNPTRSHYGGTALLTVLDFDLLDDDPYSFGPTYPSFPNLYAMQSGVIPLGWDVWPAIALLHRTVSVAGMEMEHFGMQIAKIA